MSKNNEGSTVLTYWGRQHRCCDNISRRDFLQVGALGLGGMTLADVLRLLDDGQPISELLAS